LPVGHVKKFLSNSYLLCAWKIALYFATKQAGFRSNYAVAVPNVTNYFRC